MTEISVIIPTKDRAETLTDCLSSLLKQATLNVDFEVIVVDNGSVDNTKSVAESFMSLLNLKYVFAPQPGLHVGRHAGARVAQAEILAFIDDDVQVESQWILGLKESFAASDVGLVGGNNYPDFRGPVPGWLQYRWGLTVEIGKALGSLSILDFGQGMFDLDPRFVWGCNFSIRRKVLDLAQGFHPDGFPKELIKFRGDGESYVARFVVNSGYRCLFNSKVSVRHLVSAERMVEEYFSRREYSQGISDSYMDIRNAGGLHLSGFMVFRRYVRRVRASIERMLAKRKSGLSKDVQNWMLLKCVMEKSYWNGYSFHRRSVSRDINLLKWVLKEEYRD